MIAFFNLLAVDMRIGGGTSVEKEDTFPIYSAKNSSA